MKKRFSEQYHMLLNDFEDYLNSGFRREFQSPADEGESLSAEDELEVLIAEISHCTKCPLHQTRNNTVPGTGVLSPEVFVVGEGPGREEDETGEPFVGKAGRYLDSWLTAVDLSRETNCYIGNIVKCRPPQNRDPLPEEKTACIPYLEKQIALLRPRVILCLGRIAAQAVFKSEEGIGRLRGRTGSWAGIPVIATYHPSAVLRNQDLKRPVWEDLKRLRTLLDTADD